LEPNVATGAGVAHPPAARFQVERTSASWSS